ncbi:hypothetical protein NVP1127O_53 [Vibrio phage 1.127.O._10N.286.52.E12]|nr:hypothetical protein NVP1127O_53 [Vibrio phage 1.127.O._10N.286.52.E12]
MNAVFTYNQEMATQIGNGGQYVTTSGGYDLKIVRAQFVNGKALEFDFETRDGLKLNYVSINYTKNDGQPNEFGQKMIHAIMGCCGANQLTQDANGNIPELFGKFIKAVVQRVDYTKTSGVNAGQDGYKFDFKMPAMMSTGQTIKEYVEQKQAESFDKYASTIEDKDDRTQQGASGGVGNQSYTNIPDDFDDAPF